MANKKNKKNKKKNNLHYRKQVKKQSFSHNGIKYQRSNDTVLVKIMDSIENKYVGIDIKRVGNNVVFDRFYKSNESEAFIFMLSKEVFEKFGIAKTLKMLKDEGFPYMNYNEHALVAKIV